MEKRLHGKAKRQVVALEGLKKLLANGKYLPKRFRDTEGNVKLIGAEFDKARKKYVEELKIEIKKLEERIKDARYEQGGYI